MAILTQPEALAVRLWLAGVEGPERRQAGEVGLTLRTYERLLRRAYAEGWVFDRFVPDPTRCGLPHVFVILAQPFAEDVAATTDTWARQASNVLLWAGRESVFGVFFSMAPVGHFLRTLYLPTGRAQAVLIASSPAGGGLPVYFDFEAAWARFTGLDGSISYPQPIPAAKVPPERSTQVPFIDRRALAELVRLGSTASAVPTRRGKLWITRRGRRLLEAGVVQRRTFLDPRRLVDLGGPGSLQLAYVCGDLTPSGDLRALFRTLSAAHVSPVFLAGDEVHILFLALAWGPGSPAVTTATRFAVLRSIARHLNHVQVIREPLATLSVVSDHRYDRLFPEVP